MSCLLLQISKIICPNNQGDGGEKNGTRLERAEDSPFIHTWRWIMKEPLRVLENASKGSLIYFLLAEVHVFEMCFTLSTVSADCCCVAPAGVPGAGFDAFEAVEVDPVIATS
jgi:hypothetical protein